MGYSNDYGFPKITDDIYKEIKTFEPYELTHCVVYEMAVRNKEIKEKLDRCNRIRIIKIKLEKRYRNKYLLKADPMLVEGELVLSKKIEYYSRLADTLTLWLITKHLIYPDNYKIKNTGLEDVLLLEKILDKPLSKYKTNQAIHNELTVSQGIEIEKDFFDIGNINLKFKRQVYDTNQMEIIINFSLPKKETQEYLKYILDTVYSSDKIIIKSPKVLCGDEVEDAIKTDNYPEIPTALKLSNMFFVYDYVTARFEIEESKKNDIEKEDDKEERDTILKTEIFHEVADVVYEQYLEELEEIHSEDIIKGSSDDEFGIKTIIDDVKLLSYAAKIEDLKEKYPIKKRNISFKMILDDFTLSLDKTESLDKIEIGKIRKKYTTKKLDLKNNDIFKSLELLLYKVQIKILQEKYSKRIIDSKSDCIFDNIRQLEDLKLGGDTVSNYYYAIRPYIEEYRYPEFLTGDSIVSGTEF